MRIYMSEELVKKGLISTYVKFYADPSIPNILPELVAALQQEKLLQEPKIETEEEDVPAGHPINKSKTMIKL